MSRPDLNEVLRKRAEAAQSAEAQVPETTGNVMLLLNEIRHALEHLAVTGEPGMIDMRRVPLTEGDEDALEAELGRGEVTATIDATGPSEVYETAYPGVWMVTHLGSEGGEVLSKFIEITPIPEILLSQREDMTAGIARLITRLEQHTAEVDL